MVLYGYQFIRESDLFHYGILGQKWGVRRFQNMDGSLTSIGKKRSRNNKASKTRVLYSNQKHAYDIDKNALKTNRAYQRQIKVGKAATLAMMAVSGAYSIYTISKL